MKEKVEKFWNDHKDTIKNVTIAVAVPVAVIALMGIKRLNKVINENGLDDLFYGELEELIKSEEEA